ncbi:MAG: dihydroorotase [Desulfococcaceae bacterium]
MRTLIKRGHVLDPGKLDGKFDLLVEDGKIREIRPEILAENVDRTVDATGLLVVPGLIDLHVHFREPGQEYKETIQTGCEAAARGGFTAVCTMPNTVPPNDGPEVTSYILEKARVANGVRVHPVAAISRGLRGEELCEFAALKAAGAVAVSDDGMPVRDARMMRRALEYAKGFDLLVMSHSEELSLSAGGAMNEGETATRLGLPGIPNAAESVAVMRDIALAELTGARLHIAHVSTAESVRAIREAKLLRGARVTAETAPHYFSLTDQAVENYNTHAKMNPPLRTGRDREAIREALADGALDAIATDHAPHAPLEKEVEFDRAANGVIGLETSLPVSLKLVSDGLLSMEALVTRMSIAPARILGIDNRLTVGNPADITMIDPEMRWTVDARDFASKGRNTPFDGWPVRGRAVATVVEGRFVWDMLSSN